MMFAVPDSFSWPMANFAQRLRDLRALRANMGETLSLAVICEQGENGYQREFA